MQDPHSYANPEESRVEHIGLELEVDFERRVLRGRARLRLEKAGDELILDTRDLTIFHVDAPWRLGARDAILGSALTVELRAGQREVTIDYETSPGATALQWLERCLFTQSQAIHARSWIPLQDTPGVRVTYAAEVRGEMTALMAAARVGAGRFVMPQPVPPYLIALAVGDFEFAPLGERTGVWAEREWLERAAWEFADLEAMVAAAERLYGAYRWERYDVLIMPASFPFGGMENPRLTFATPTILAGDRSLVSLIAHELAHSWSGNLVTNATWRDFWLNEGFTTYIERRIQEEIYGERRARMEAYLEMEELRAEMAGLAERDQVLAVDLRGRDPDDGVTLVPYVKGAALLRRMEQEVGRERFDGWIGRWFARHAFQSVTTEDFLEFAGEEFAGIDFEEWIFRPGLPADCEQPEWQWTGAPSNTQEWLHYLRGLPEDADLAALDAAHGFTESGNSEIVVEWLRRAIASGYEAAMPRLERFLCEVGRRKFVVALYKALPRERAREIFEKAKAGYHPLTRATVKALLLE